MTDIWTMDANSEADDRARQEVFCKIAPESNWKMPIDCWINEDDYGACNMAAIWFTGGSLEVSERAGNRIRVVGAGYYMNIGA